MQIWLIFEWWIEVAIMVNSNPRLHQVMLMMMVRQGFNDADHGDFVASITICASAVAKLGTL